MQQQGSRDCRAAIDMYAKRCAVNWLSCVLPMLQEELEQWAAAAKAKEEDRLALERYRRQVGCRAVPACTLLLTAAEAAHGHKIFPSPLSLPRR